MYRRRSWPSGFLLGLRRKSSSPVLGIFGRCADRRQRRGFVVAYRGDAVEDMRASTAERVGCGWSIPSSTVAQFWAMWRPHAAVTQSWRKDALVVLFSSIASDLTFLLRPAPKNILACHHDRSSEDCSMLCTG